MLTGQITGPCRIELQETPEPELDPSMPGQMIFEPHLACLCGSDLPYFEASDEQPNLQPGQSLHEMIGRVVETNGSRFEPGAMVLAVPPEHLGLFERFIVDERRAIPIDDRVPVEHALMAQPLGTVLFALRKLPNLIGRTVAVIGQGPMGQLFNAALSNLGAEHIIGIDHVPGRLEISRQMGATEVCCSTTDDPHAIVQEITSGTGADVTIEVVGHRDQALNDCIPLTRYGGRILFFGVPAEIVDGIRFRDLFFKNLTLHTSVFPDFERDFPLAMRWVGERRIDVAPLLTHRFPLAEIQQAFELFRDRTDGVQKVLIDFPAANG